ncbi:MAG: hypothetical protein KF893_25530 [Caldilineaceae bacterium]|nr:hypothetical protein [Caldilineaceae bacterium]
MSNQQQIERQLETERRNLADLEAALATANGNAERLEAEAARDLAGADLAQLEDLALQQSQARLEAEAQRRVAAELTRRVTAKRRDVAQLDQQLKNMQLEDLQRDVDRVSDQIMDAYAAILPMLDQLSELTYRGGLLGRSLQSHVPNRLRRDELVHAIENYHRERQPFTPAPVASAPQPAQVAQQVVKQARRTAKRLVPSFMEGDDDEDADWSATAPGMN